jgi:hypothetical protein
VKKIDGNKQWPGCPPPPATDWQGLEEPFKDVDGQLKIDQCPNWMKELFDSVETK